MQRKEDMQQVAIADDRRIKRHLRDFHVPRLAGANLLIAGIGDVPAHITRADRFHAVNLLDGGLDTPEASAAEIGNFAGWHTKIGCASKRVVASRSRPLQIVNLFKTPLANG